VSAAFGWLLLAGVLGAGVLAVCSAHIPVLRVWTGAAPLDGGERDDR
jgi:hypothetical protein